MKISKIYIPILIAVSICIGVVLGAYIFSNTTYLPSKNANRHKLNRLIDLIDNEFVDDVNTDSIVDIAVNDILSKLDPHSFYISPAEKERLATNMNGEFVGIGITYYMLNDTLAVINTIAGGPSEKAGIKSGDRILLADEKKIYGEKLPNDSLLAMLRGPLDSNIKLRVFRKSTNKIFDCRFKRKNVPVKSVDAAFMLNKNTAYVKINRFAANTHLEFDAKVKEIQKQNPENIIIDLRNNTGGYVEVAEKIIDKFLPENQVIVRLISKSEEEQVVLSSKNTPFAKNNLYILVDENTASASEIFAGAIQDNDRGQIVGRRTYGKGLVQQELSLGDGSAVRLSVSKYHTPSGRSIQKPYVLDDTDYLGDFHQRMVSKELYVYDSIKVIDSTSFKSLNGKAILQANGGIIPDVFIPLSDDFVQAELKMVMQSAFISNYIFQLIDDKRAEMSLDSYDDLVNQLENTDYYYNKVVGYLKKYPLNFNPEKYKSIIKAYITAEIISQIKGEAYFYQYISPLDDEVVQLVQLIQAKNVNKNN
ncbi:S41 family peptidase [Flavobacterium agricola]|uniref:S41 family peptidase n=1 Tax=Flavobacterium agricola TaxID=2870839 RepID=A0ABY6LYD0_9FLAO|nr:S41 family peptidase [Flavobacterium agricola]UYW01186.1 S41 family peptidase [Flavobacterium agricola]